MWAMFILRVRKRKSKIGTERPGDKQTNNTRDGFKGLMKT